MVGMEIKPRACLVCTEPCLTEGQLCRDCVAAGHRVDDDAVYVSLTFTNPFEH